MYYYWPYNYSVIGQTLPPGLRKKIPTFPGQIPTNEPLPPAAPTPPENKPFEPGIAIVIHPLGSDVLSEPRRASNRLEHLFNGNSVQVLETDIPEVGLGEDSRPRWWKVITQSGNTGFVRALEETGGYKFEPLTILPGRTGSSTVYSRRHGPVSIGELEFQKNILAQNPYPPFLEDAVDTDYFKNKPQPRNPNINSTLVCSENYNCIFYPDRGILLSQMPLNWPRYYNRSVRRIRQFNNDANEFRFFVPKDTSFIRLTSPNYGIPILVVEGRYSYYVKMNDSPYATGWLVEDKRTIEPDTSVKIGAPLVCYSFALRGFQIFKLYEFKKLMANVLHRLGVISHVTPNVIKNIRQALVDLHLTPTEISNAWNVQLPNTLENISLQLNRPSNYLSLEKIGFLPRYMAEAINLYFGGDWERGVYAPIYILDQEFNPVSTKVGCVSGGDFIGTEVSPTPPYEQRQRGPIEIVYPAVPKPTGPILAPPIAVPRRNIPFMKD